MNLPNRITLVRCFGAVLFILLFSFDHPITTIIALVLSLAVFLTDSLDGRIARSRNLVTDFGKLFDPLVDKIAVLTVLACMVDYHRIVPLYIFYLIFFREVLVTVMREFALRREVVMAARLPGKLKTTGQVIVIHLILAGIAYIQWMGADNPRTAFPLIFLAAHLLLLVVLALTIYSGAFYFVKLRHIFLDKTPLPPSFESAENPQSTSPA